MGESEISGRRTCMCFTLAAMRSPRLFALPRESGGQLDPTGRLPACLYIYISPRRSGHHRRPRHGGAASSIVYERIPVERQIEGGSSRASSERDCIVAGRSIGVSIVAGHGVEGELLGRGADPARRPLPRGVPPLALARRPPQPAQLHRRHQRRRAPPLGLLHDEEQREAGDPGGAVGAERADGLHAGGHDVHPLLHRRRRRAQQHLRREEAAQRRRLRRARRVHDGAQVRRPPPRLPPRLPQPQPRHLHAQPGLLPRQRALPVAGAPPPAHQGLRRRRHGEGVPAQPRRQPVLLRRRAAPALDLRARPAVPLLHGHAPDTLQHRHGRVRPEREQQWRGQSGHGGYRE